MQLVLIAAQSLDGFITRHDEPGTAFTSPADQTHFRTVLQNFDCSVMGAETYRVARNFIRARLTPTRRRIVVTRDPARYGAEAVAGQLEFTAAASGPAALCATLAAEGHRRCAVLGGATLHDWFLAASLVDELWLTLEPRLFGQGTPFLREAHDLTLSLIDVQTLGASGTLLVCYRAHRP